MHRTALVCFVLLASCTEPARSRAPVEDLAPVEVALPEPEPVGLLIERPRYDEAELSRTEPTFETIDARDMRSRRLPPVAIASLLPREVTTEADLREAVALSLLRIAATEVEFQNERDVVGFWQVANAVRLGHCDNRRFPRAARAVISQCLTVDGRIVRVRRGETINGAEETLLSALRRLSPNVLDTGREARNRRQRWARELALDCAEPSSYRSRGAGWGAIEDDCRAIAELVRGLADGTVRRRVTGHATPVAWGGRCEDAGGACDDRIACTRGLARIPDTGTSNALWCRVGSRGCPEPVVRGGEVYSDPVCLALEAPLRPRAAFARRHLDRDGAREEIPAPASVRVASDAAADENADHEGEADGRDPRRVPALERGGEVASQPEEA